MAKVLCLDGNFEKARDIYEYALQKLPADHSGREVGLFLSFLFCSLLNMVFLSLYFPPTNHLQVLEQLLKKLQDKLAGGNRRDPFTTLPLEIAELTLRHLSFKQIV